MVTVLVLMSTYNGEAYLTEQVESILKQADVNVKLLVRDDGSTDNTLRILNKYATEEKLDYITGKILTGCTAFGHWSIWHMEQITMLLRIRTIYGFQISLQGLFQFWRNTEKPQRYIVRSKALLMII